MTQGVGLRVVATDRAGSKARVRRHAEPAGEEILPDGEARKGIWAEHSRVRIQVGRGGRQVFVRQPRVLWIEVGRDLRVAAHPHHHDKLPGGQRQAFSRSRGVPGRDRRIGSGLVGDQTTLPDHLPAGWCRGRHPVGGQGIRRVGIPVGFWSDVDALWPDVPGRFAGSHKPEVPRLFGGVVDLAGVIEVHDEGFSRMGRSVQPDHDLVRTLTVQFGGRRQRARGKRQEPAVPGYPGDHEGFVERDAELTDLPAAGLDRHAIHAPHPVGRGIDRQLHLVPQHADGARIDGRRPGGGQDGAARSLKQDDDEEHPEEAHDSPSSASTKALGSKAWRSSTPSPTPM